jgi:hypothetical protein
MSAASYNCPAALAGATNPPDASVGNVHLGHSAPTMHVVPALPAIYRSARVAAPFPAAAGGAASPLYILYGRFLV